MENKNYFESNELECHGENPKNYQYYGYSTGCGCGGANYTTPELLALLNRMRREAGPLTLSCSTRCSIHNARVGGAGRSAHLYGMAADVQLPPGYTVEMLADVARACGAEGILKYEESQFVHVSMGAGEGECWMD